MTELFGTLLVDFDESQGYDTEISMLFKKGTKYIWLDANGCSCWSGDYDGWEINKTELKTLAKKSIDNRYSWRDTADVKVAEWVMQNL